MPWCIRLCRRSEGHSFLRHSTSHFFAGDPLNPVLTATAATFGSATGIGDTRSGSRHLTSTERLGLALMAVPVLPTGSPTTSPVPPPLAAGSRDRLARFGDFSPHLTPGMPLGPDPAANDVILATGGFDQRVSWHACGGCDLGVEVVSGLQLPAR